MSIPRLAQSRFFLVLGFVYLAILLWSGINPYDRFTWVLEVIPSLFGFVILLATYRKFQFSRFVYVLFVIHSAILFIGGKYTYALNPWFEWIKQVTGGDRNQYDKIGHFAQGFFPAFFMYELFVHQAIIAKKRWIPFFIVTTTALVTVVYELLEWWTAVFSGDSADAFLGTQGYVWDTQSDMLLALVGATIACCCFSWLTKRRILK
jgi:putative membrane protein